MALLLSLLKGAASSTDLNGQLLALGVTNKLAGRLLHILGGARGLIHSLAHLLALTIADLLGWLVTLLHRLIEGLLLESDLTALLKVLLADLLL